MILLSESIYLYVQLYRVQNTFQFRNFSMRFRGNVFRILFEFFFCRFCFDKWIQNQLKSICLAFHSSKKKMQTLYRDQTAERNATIFLRNEYDLQFLTRLDFGRGQTKGNRRTQGFVRKLFLLDQFHSNFHRC